MSEPHHHPKLSESATHLSSARAGEQNRLLWVMALTGVTMVAELVAGILARSLSLLSDAFHMLTHFMAMALSYVAIWIATRPAPPDKTYRYWRVEILAGLLNGLALIPIAGYVVYEGFHRLHDPVPIDATMTLAVGGIGLLVNVISALLLHPHSKHDLNMRGAFFHMLADSASSVGVIVAGLFVRLKGWTQADPLVAIGISVFIFVWCFSLLRSSVQILLESVPRHMKLEDIRAAMKEVKGVAEVHDLHVWTITSRMYSLTAHVRLCEDLKVSETEELGHRLERLLDERYEINHATLQFEVANGHRQSCDHEAAAPAPDPPHSH